MAFINKTAFEVSNSNSVNNQMQQIPGKFGTYTENTYAAQTALPVFFAPEPH